MELINRINNIYKDKKDIKIFLDMDGTVVEFIFDSKEGFSKKGGYLKKRPIKPIIKKIKEVKNIYPDIDIKILSCSKNNDMTKQKNEWLDIYMPFIRKESRIFINEEKSKFFGNNGIKSEFIEKNILNNEVAIFIDDDHRILNESKKILGNKVIPILVTSLLL